MRLTKDAKKLLDMELGMVIDAMKRAESYDNTSEVGRVADMGLSQMMSSFNWTNGLFDVYGFEVIHYAKENGTGAVYAMDVDEYLEHFGCKENR